MKHVNGRLEPPRTVNPEVPERLNTLVVKLLAKPSEERLPDAATLVEDLRSMDRSSVSAADTRVLDRTTSHERPDRTGWTDHTRLSPTSPTLPGQHGSSEAGGSQRQGGPSRGVGTALAWATALVLLISVGSLSAVALDGRFGLFGGSTQPTEDDRNPSQQKALTEAGQQVQTPSAAPVSSYSPPADEPTSITQVPGTVHPTDVEETAGGYYRAAGVENWSYTYDNLDSGTQSMFAEEWLQKNQWLSNNGTTIYHIESVRLDGASPTRCGGGGEADRRGRSFLDPSSVLRLRGRLMGTQIWSEEIDLFMPGTSYEEFVAAR